MAESFGVDPSRYDRSRPGYPAALIERIVAGSPGPDVLDVGCGTGIAARQFQAVGAHVLGVEPDERMAEFARRGGIEVEVSTFEEWSSRGRRFDAVVAATAWHWVNPVAGSVRAAEVLRPGGRLAVFWHAFEWPDELAETFGAAFRRVAPDSPVRFDRQPGLSSYEGMMDMAADGLREAGGFGAPERWRYDWERVYTRDEWLDQLPTTGLLTRLPAEKLAEVLDAAGGAVDAIGGRFTMAYRTVCLSAVRQSAG